MSDHASKQNNANTHTDVNKSSQPVNGENEIEAPAPETVVRLQRMIGNRAVQRLLAKSNPDPAASQPDALIQRALHADAERAFKFAVAQNPAYDAAKTATDKHVTTKEQGELSVLRGRTSRVRASPEPEKRLKDFIRAYLLKEYSTRMSDPIKAAKGKRAGYFEKAKQTRDKYKAFIDLGVTAPETRAFLDSEGFAGGIPASPTDLARTPKIDVRATFIGGEVLGMRLRAHLFIVLTMANGKQMYFRGGPSGTSANVTVANFGDYVPGTVDWDPSAPSVTVMEGDKVMEKLDPLIEASQAVNSMFVPYEVSKTGGPNENCNATAWTILDRAGVNKNKPTGVHPGWGHILGAQSGKGSAMKAKEDNSGPGLPYEVTEDNVKVYSDRAYITELKTVKTGTKVDLLSDPSRSQGRVRLDGKIGFMDTINLQPYLEKGVKMRVGTTVDVYDARRVEVGHTLFDGTIIEVMDADFASNPTADGEMVKIKYVNIMGKAAIGYVPDWNLEKIT